MLQKAVTLSESNEYGNAKSLGFSQNLSSLLSIKNINQLRFTITKEPLKITVVHA
jgi:hypothetical protein